MLLLALGSVLLAFVSSASARGVLPSNVRGVNIHFAGTGNPNEVAMLARGFAMVRMDLSWQATEVAPSVYNFTQYDILYDTLNAQDVQLWLILDYTNPIYCPNGTSPITPAQQAAFARWSAAAAVHFQPRNPAVIFEIYNEPNGGFWKPVPNATQYAQMALATVTAIRAVAPDTLIVGPTTAGVDIAYIQQVFATPGILPELDAVTVHPYRNGAPETVHWDYATLRALIANLTAPGDSPPPCVDLVEAKIISSEWGWTTCESPCTPPGPQTTEDGQARWGVRRFLLDAIEGVPVSIDYDWHDDFVGPTQREANFGSVRYPYQTGNVTFPYDPKPAFLAFEAFQSALRNTDFVSTIPTTPQGPFALQFRRRSDHASPFAAWSLGDPGSCPNVPVASRVDCGYYAVSKSECEARGCCYGASSGPWCYFPDPTTSQSATLQLPMPSGASACFAATDYLGRSQGQVCASTAGSLALTLASAPTYLVPV